MINQEPFKIMEAASTEILRHPNSMDCTVYRKVLLRTPTLDDLDILESEDELDFEYQSLGMGKVLVTSRFEGELLDDYGDVISSDKPMQEAQIVSIDVPGFTPQKQDLIGAMLGCGIVIGFEIMGVIDSDANSTLAAKFVIVSRDDLHDLSGENYQEGV